MTRTCNYCSRDALGEEQKCLKCGGTLPTAPSPMEKKSPVREEKTTVTFEPKKVEIERKE